MQGLGRAKLLVLDPQTLRVQRTLTTAVTGFGSNVGSLDLDVGAVWWNNGDVGTLLRVDISKRRLVSAIRITERPDSLADFEPYAVATGAGTVWLTVRVAP